jgi:Fe-S cluster assembly protein SufD
VSALAVERDRIVSGFPGFAAALEAGAPAWLPPLREAAIERFAELGFPSRKREEWKYTNVTPIARAAAEAAGEAGERSGEEIAAAVASIGVENALVFVNGRFAPQVSAPPALPRGAVVDSLARVLREQPALAAPLLSRPWTGDERPFVALNAAFQRDGAFVALPAGSVLEEPIQLVYLSTDGDRNPANHPRNLISIAESASAVVVERYLALGNSAYLTNAVTEIEIGTDAQLDHVSLECESDSAFHLGTLSARLGRNARFRSHAISLGAALCRNEVAAVLAEVGADCVLNGLFVANGERHVDSQTTIDHAEPHGTSSELYKGILDGRSHGVFNGKVIVRPKAQKTNARQSNPNLLLSDGAEIDTRPNLEIHADDVKCSHGSTIGRLEEDALFFLRARGIDVEQARQMLCRAFAAEVIDQIPWAPLREEIAQRAGAKIGNGGEEAA